MQNFFLLHWINDINDSISNYYVIIEPYHLPKKCDSWCIHLTILSSKKKFVIMSHIYTFDKKHKSNFWTKFTYDLINEKIIHSFTAVTCIDVVLKRIHYSISFSLSSTFRFLHMQFSTIHNKILRIKVSFVRECE